MFRLLMSDYSISCRLNMGSKYIIGSVLGSFAIAYLVDHYVADKKIFGGIFCLFLIFILPQVNFVNFGDLGEFANWGFLASNIGLLVFVKLVKAYMRIIGSLYS